MITDSAGRAEKTAGVKGAPEPPALPPAHLQPLAAPALAVLAIFSVVWRWNDFLWPLVVLTRKELYTLQIGLNVYAGELNVQWHYILAMTVVAMLPVVVVFVFLQRWITTGIAGTGLK